MFQLADRLKIPVGELMSRITNEEYLEWRALTNVEEREREHARKVRAKGRGR